MTYDFEMSYSKLPKTQTFTKERTATLTIFRLRTSAFKKHKTNHNICNTQQKSAYQSVQKLIKSHRYKIKYHQKNKGHEW